MPGDQTIMATDTIRGITGSATVTVQSPGAPGVGTPGTGGKDAETWESPAPAQSAKEDTPSRSGDSPQTLDHEPPRAMRPHHTSAALIEASDRLFIDEEWIG